MEKKFSKGKWVISGSCSDSIRISTENYDVVADVYDGWNSVDKQIDMDICVANAKLIAAAPDLLAACICESILDKCERNKVIYELQQYGYKGLELPQQFVDRLRIQAIKKATK